MLAKTFIPKEKDIVHKWYLIDAKDKVLGRLAVKLATLLTGKRKVIYTPHMECGDHVVVINAKNIRVTGNKLKDKIYAHYTGYPGGRREFTLETLMTKKPTFVITEAVRKMLPKNRMGDKILKHLHVYEDANHEHQAQKPEVLN